MPHRPYYFFGIMSYRTYYFFSIMPHRTYYFFDILPYRTYYFFALCHIAHITFFILWFIAHHTIMYRIMPWRHHTFDLNSIYIHQRKRFEEICTSSLRFIIPGGIFCKTLYMEHYISNMKSCLWNVLP